MKATGSLTALWFLIIITSPVSKWLAAPLENYAPPLKVAGHPAETVDSVAIVVLGAGFTNDTSLQPIHQLLGTVRGRLVEGYRVYRKLPQALFVTSGPCTNEVTAQGEMVGHAAVQLGVDPQDTVHLTRPFNTRSEAQYFAERLPEVDTVIVATNALHMKRALFWFRHYGKFPIPAPTNFKLKTDAFDPDPFFSVGLNDMNLMNLMAKALHEYAGLCYAKWKTGEL